MSDGVRITKMSGAGNDFVVLDPEQAARLGQDPRAWVRRICRRGLSVGADGVLVVAPSGPDRVAVRFYNPDGSAVFCGNGSRCAARFAHLRGWVGASMTLETAAGVLPASVRQEVVRVTLPAPRDRGTRTIAIEPDSIEGRWIHAGVPHFVVPVPSLEGDALSSWGPRVRRHPAFGDEGTNFDLVTRIDAETLGLRTWERGVEGETLACGSGAVAAAFAARLAGGAASVTVLPTSRVPLRVELVGDARQPRAAILEGEARLVFEGEVVAAEATDARDPRARG